MIILFCILLYIIVVVFVCAVFSVMNEKYNWISYPDDVTWPLIGIFWPVSIPCILIIYLACILYESVYSFLDKKINGD